MNVSKDVRRRIEAIQVLIGTDPKISCAVFEQGINVGSAQRVGIIGVMPVRAKAVAIVTLETVLRTQPQEATIILNEFADSAMALAYFERHASEAHVIGFFEGKSHRTITLGCFPRPYAAECAQQEYADGWQTGDSALSW